MKFQQLIYTKMLELQIFLALKLSDFVFILLINVKKPTIVGILTFISRITGIFLQFWEGALGPFRLGKVVW